MNARDREIMKELGKESVGEQLTTAAFVLLFGVSSGLACAWVRKLAINVLTDVLFSAELEATQYGGYMYIVNMGSAFFAVALWLILLFVVWHMLSKRHDKKQKIRLGGLWSAGAAAVWLVTFIVEKIL